MESRYVLLGKVGDATTAHLYAARLQAEGIEVRLHGEGLGPYRMTVGQMAVIEMWVPEDRLADAQEIMMAAEIDDAFDVEEGPRAPPRPALYVAVAVFLLAVVILLVIRASGLT